MLASGRADVFVQEDVPLAELLASLPHADKLKLLEKNFTLTPHAIALRRDDPDFKSLVDATVIGMMKSGEMEKICNTWFMSAIPPNNVNLRIPMSDVLGGFMRNPSDTGN